MATCLSAPAFASGPGSVASESAPAVRQHLRDFGQMGSVLYVAAHPDDENTQLIAYLSRGLGVRTAYLSLTRGDGGQNVLGPEFGSALGVARTQELLAARRLDGGKQFFSRALDFGYSKDVQETLNNWDRQQVLSDIVRVIRTFRPDVIITRFSTQPGGTHGHHTASAVLALEAFKLAGDPRSFPEQISEDGLAPWQPKRILQNGSFGRTPPPGAALSMEVSGMDPVLGISYGEIAALSRAMHKTQGLGNFGAGTNQSAPRTELFYLLAGEAASKSIFDGVDPTWNRVTGGAEIGRRADEALAKFDEKDLTANVPALLALRRLLAGIADDPLVADKKTQLDHILQACLGLAVTTTVAHADIVPGETLRLHHRATITANLPVSWLAMRYPSLGSDLKIGSPLVPGTTASRDSTRVLPARTPLSQPYWLRTESTSGMFQVEETKLIGQPQNPPVLPVEYVFEIAGQKLAVADEPVELEDGPKGETLHRLEVIPPISLKFDSPVELFAPGATRPVTIEITAARADAAGSLRLECPAGWTIAPSALPFHLATAGAKMQFTFTVTAPPRSTVASITAHTEVRGMRISTDRLEIRYEHIPRQLLQPPARLRAVALELAIRGKKVGYVSGAGDTVAENLRQMGYTVTSLTGPELTAEKLKTFDAVVLGVRAFNTRTDLVPQLPALFAYVEKGGTVVEQYNRPGGDLKTELIAPYRLHLSNERVTDENAAVTFLAPDHPALTSPNRITAADFDGWVQERGVYFPNEWDEHFTPLLACSDAGEAPLKGGLLVVKHGQGYFIYTGLAFFRQLPAGVPGAYRLFANLVSLGK